MHEDQTSISLIESILAEELRRELKLTHYVPSVNELLLKQHKNQDFNI